MWYNLNIQRLTALLTPTFLRKEKFLAWIRALHFPLIKVLDVFNFNRNENLYNLAHNGQVCHLRKVLNDRFDPSQRRIKIADAQQYTRTWLYAIPYSQPIYLGKRYIHTIGAFADNGFDFLVLIPQSLNQAISQQQLRAIVDKYKLTSKRYKIVITND